MKDVNNIYKLQKIIRSQDNFPKFQVSYMFCKVELYVAVTLPFPKGDRCTHEVALVLTYFNA